MSSTGSRSGGSRRSTRLTPSQESAKKKSSEKGKEPSSEPLRSPRGRGSEPTRSSPRARNQPPIGEEEEINSSQSTIGPRGSSQSTIGPRGSRRSNARAAASETGLSHASQSQRSDLFSGNLGQFSDPINLSSPLHYGSTEGTRPRDPRSREGSVRSSASAFRRRADIATDAKYARQINVGSAPEMGATPGSSEPGAGDGRTSESHVSTGPQLVIWGTDVSINRCKDKFKSFLRFPKFDVNDLESDELQPKTQSDLLDGPSEQRQQPLYLLKLEEVYTLEDPFLNINCKHVHQFDADLYRQLVNYPQEVIPAFDMAANEVFHEVYPGAVLPHQINVRPFNVVKTTSLRSLNPEDLNQLVTLSGMVTRCSNLIPEMCEGYFECSVCSYSTLTDVDRGRIVEPMVCRHCNTNFSFQLVHNRSKFIDKQQIKLQESPDDMPAGQTPYTVLVYACAELVDSVQPGDRVTVTGIYRATPVRINPRQRNVKSVYRTHIDVVHFRKIDNKRLHDDNKEFNFTADRVDELKALSRCDDVYERLTHAIAPSIYNYEDMKKGVLLQLFGGTKKDASNSESGKWRHFRSEINIILCGDPGTSKSQLLKFVNGLVPRGQYTSGKGSSAVGLTAYITKDPDTRQMVLQTGALVLSDGGICCIDEFDKMSDSTRSVLHEVMEQQTLSIAKAGIVCQLNARTSILAAANPVESQWNKNKTIIENIQLPHTLLSRFDLIFLLVDPQDEGYDRRLARHLVSLYYRSQDEAKEELLDMSLLKDYIAYARNYVHPRLSEESSLALIQAYVEMRKVGSGKGQISAYPRQLESLIRLAEAHARVRLSSSVEMVDVNEATRIHKEAMKQAATDPSSGKIDMSILTTGMSATNRKRKGEIALVLKRLLTTKRSESSGSQEQPQYGAQAIFNELKSGSDLNISREMFEDALKDLHDEGFLLFYGGRFVRICN